MNYPKNIDMKVFDAPQEKTYIMRVSGFVEVEAYDWEDATEIIKDMRIVEMSSLEIDI